MATTNEHFSPFKREGAVQLKNWGSFARKIYSSTAQSTSVFWSKPKAVDVAASTVNNISTTAGLVGVGAGIAALCGEAALVAAGTAGFVAAVGGPQVAITAGVVGLALFVKSVYSNREHTHEQLAPFMWSLIDDESPIKSITTIDDLGDAAGHALNLMTDGPAQFKLMGNKLQGAEKKFEEFFVDLWKLYEFMDRKSTVNKNKNWIENLNNVWSSANVQGKKSYASTVLARYNEISPKWDESQKKIQKASTQGGEIFEFMRRLVHTGNYLQCAHLINLYSFHKLKNNSNQIIYVDPLVQWTGAKYYRNRLIDISVELKKRKDLFEKLQKMAEEAAILMKP